MSLTAGLRPISEWRGIEGLVAAEVLCDDNSSEEGHGYVTGDVFSIAGINQLTKNTPSTNEVKYYDNMPAISISTTGKDEVTCSVSALDLEVLAKITGQYYDDTTGALIEGPRTVKYFAIGYKTKRTNGDTMYVWRYKGTFNIPNSEHNTEDESANSNGQEIVFTGITTTHKFTKTNEGAKSLAIDIDAGLVDQSTIDGFFTEVTTPDDLASASTYYNVTNVLARAANSNTAVKVKAGTTGYNATLTAESTYSLTTVAVYMGGADVTSSVYTSGTGAIAIADVTGDIVIIATGTK